jgi:replicative DNA helicase
MEEQATNKRTTRFTRNKTEDISNLFYGKIPPQARELEEAVLGAILIEKDAISYVSDILKPESFYVDAHSTIFRSIQSLFGKSQPIDLINGNRRFTKKCKTRRSWRCIII